MKRFFMLLFAMVMIPYVTTLAWTGRIRTDVGESIPTEEFLVGMVAAEIPAEYGIEKNEKLGKKLYITGKGRCNITNAGDMDTDRKSTRLNSSHL